MTERTEPLARVMTSEALLDRIGKQLGVDPSQISATTQVTQSAPRSLIEPDNERRAAGILGEQASYRIEAQAEPNLPVLGIYAEAPTAAEATSLADTAVEALNGYLRTRAARTAPRPRTSFISLSSALPAAARSTRPLRGRSPRSLLRSSSGPAWVWPRSSPRSGAAEKGVEAGRRGSGRGGGGVNPSAQGAATRDDRRPRPTATRRLAAHDPRCCRG